MRLILAPVLLAAACFAQPPQAQPQSKGVEAEWDIRKLLESLSAAAKRLQPIIEQTNPRHWNDQTAAQSYAGQWKTAQNEIQYLVGSTEALAKQPERLTVALDVFFRLQALESTVSSLMDGVRRYQNPAVGDLLHSTMSENSTNRERLRQYIVELASTKEQEFQIMDKEAQRCRAILSKQPPPASSRDRKTTKKQE